MIYENWKVIFICIMCECVSVECEHINAGVDRDHFRIVFPRRLEIDREKYFKFCGVFSRL